MRSVLVVGAHPDDESRLGGGAIALLASQGVRVHIVCATRGEGGELGEPPICERADVARVREQELRCAAAALGAASVTFLDYMDPLIGPEDTLFAFEADYETLVGQIRAAIQGLEVDAVLTHGSDGEYGHPAHLLLHRAVRDAVKASLRQPLLYTWAAAVPGVEDRISNQSDPAHLVLDVRPWFDQLEAASQCHRSQHALFKRRRQVEAIRDTLRSTEAYHRHMPPAEDGTLHDPFADLLRAAGAWKPEASANP